MVWNLSSFSKRNPDSLIIREISHSKGEIIYQNISIAELSGCMFYSVYNDSTNYVTQ